jgi:hypothetical protein
MSAEFYIIDIKCFQYDTCDTVNKPAINVLMAFLVVGMQYARQGAAGYVGEEGRCDGAAAPGRDGAGAPGITGRQ